MASARACGIDAGARIRAFSSSASTGISVARAWARRANLHMRRLCASAAIPAAL
jgi:cob(I)alamin adenosyltransferase